MLYDILPSSQIIPESKIEKLGDSPVSSGSLSHVWRGVYSDGGGSVAIKFMRHAGSSKVENTKEVRHFDPLPSPPCNLITCRTSAERS